MLTKSQTPKTKAELGKLISSSTIKTFTIHEIEDEIGRREMLRKIRSRRINKGFTIILVD